MYSNICLLFFIFLWLFTFIKYWQKHKSFNTSCVLLILFLFYSICSFFVYNDPFWGASYHSLKIYPFAYLYAVLMISLIPVFKWDNLKVQRISTPNVRVIKVISWFFVICTILRVGQLSHLYEGLINIMISSEAGYDIYIQTNIEGEANLGNGIISNIFAIFSNSLYDFAVLFFFFLLHARKLSKPLLFCLLLSFVICILLPISYSQRGPALERVLVLFIVYIAFNRFLLDNVIRVVNKFFLFLGFLTSIPVAFITIARFSDRGILGSIFCYFGQQNLNFNNYAFDNNGLRYGDRIIPVFKKFLGFENVPSNFYDRRLKYPNLKINDEVFIGHIGDFMLDFGPIITFLVFVVITIIVSRSIIAKNDYILLYRLIPLLFLLHLTIFGGLFLFPFADGENYTIIMYILMFLFLKYFR